MSLLVPVSTVARTKLRTDLYETWHKLWFCANPKTGKLEPSFCQFRKTERLKSWQILF